MHAQSMLIDTSVLAMALARGAPPPSPTATQSASRVGDRNMSMHAQRDCLVTCVWLPWRRYSMHVVSDQQDMMSVCANQQSSKFVEAVAQLLQKRKVRVARHLQVHVEAHQMQLRARHAKESDERHGEHGMSQTSVAQSVEQDRLRTIALAASGKDALCVLMQATPMQLDSAPKTLQAFVHAHWHYQFMTCGGVECVCCAWANVCGIPGVERPPRASEALVLGTYVEGMRMKTSSPKTWHREVLESHSGLSRGTTSVRKNLCRPGHHHRLAEDSFKQHCAERYRALCPSAATVEVGGNIMLIRGEAMDICVAVTDTEAAILSRLVAVYIGLRMCTSIRVISERILMHCSLTSALGHHASQRWTVEKAIAAMHDAMQDEVTHTLFHCTVA